MIKKKRFKAFLTSGILLMVVFYASGLAAACTFHSEWEMIEPGGGGAFIDIGAGPTGTVVAASDLSGVYVSYNDGSTWENRGSEEGLIYHTHASAVGFDPNDKDLIYVGTEYGMYKSDDEAHTFHPLLSSDWDAAARTGTYQVVRDESTYGSYLDPTYSSNNRQYWTAITFAPSNPNIGYASAHSTYKTNDAILFKTTDRGETWSPVKAYTNVYTNVSGTDVMSVFNEDKRIQKIVVDPTDPDTVYFLSQWDKFTKGKGLYNLGPQTNIYKSTDGGVTFSVLNGSGSNTVTYTNVTTKMAKLDNNGQQVINSTTHTAEVYDGTTTPVSFTEPVLNRDVLDFAVDPTDSDILYATKGNRSMRGLIPGEGTYKSTDGGATWTKVDDKFGVLEVKAAYGDPNQTRIRRIDINGWEAVGSYSSREYPQVWESKDGGSTFFLLADYDDFYFGAIDPHWYTQASAYTKTVATSMADPDVYYWADYQWVYKSTDGGDNWSSAASDKTKDSNGDSWYSTTGISNVVPFVIKVSEADPNIIFVGNADTGLWRSLDNGQTWQHANEPNYTSDWNGYGGQAQTIALDPDRPNVAWAGLGGGYVDQILVRSDGYGELGSWTNSHSGLPLEQRGWSLQEGAALRGLSIDKDSPINNRTLFVVADDKVYRSIDDGGNWTQVFDMTGGNPFNYNGMNGGNNSPDRQAATVVDGNYVFAGGVDGLFRSDQNGDSGTWSQIGLSEMVNIQKIIVSPEDPAHLFVVAYGTYTDSNNVKQQRGLYYSPDYGQTWEQILKDEALRGAAVNPDDEDIIMVGSSSVYNSGGKVGASRGALLTVNGGIIWQPVNEGLSWPFVRDVEFNTQDTTQVFIATPGTSYHVSHFDYSDYELPGNIVYEDDFSGTEPLSDNWLVTAGNWDKTGETLNATGTNSSLPSGTKNTIELIDKPDLKNVEFYTRFRSNGSQTGPYMRIYLREAGSTDKTVIQIDPSNIKVGSNTPTETLINSFNMFPADTDFDLKIVLNDNQLDVYYKSATATTYTLAGSTTTVSGNAGGVSLYASYTYSFDDIVIKYID